MLRSGFAMEKQIKELGNRKPCERDVASGFQFGVVTYLHFCFQNKTLYEMAVARCFANGYWVNNQQRLPQPAAT